MQFKTLAHPVVVKESLRTHTQLVHDLQDLRRTTKAFEEAGGRLSLAIHCLDTGARLFYNSGELLYPASAIKGPYLIALYQARDEGALSCDGKALARLAEPTIVASDNESYVDLSNTYGCTIFADWCVAHRVVEAQSASYQRLCENRYPFINCAELARMWKAGHRYLASDSDGAQELKDFFARRAVSPLREGIGGKAQTITKAGWYPDDCDPTYCATVDAGIVEQGSHRYVVALMTDAPSDLDLLTRMVPGLWSARTVLW